MAATLDHVLDQAREPLAKARASAPRGGRQETAPRIELAPLRDASGQDTLRLSPQVLAQQRERLAARHPDFQALAADRSAADAVGELTLDTRLAPLPVDPARLVLQVRLLDARNGNLLARSEATVLDPGADLALLTPRPPPQMAAPALAPDSAAQAAAANAAQAAAAAAQLQRANALQAAGRHSEALPRFQALAQQPGADALQARIGEYLSLSRLGRKAEADMAFAQIVTLGLKAGSLGLKLLFAPNGTGYWPDRAVSGPYAGWLKEIARQSLTLKDCLAIVGHSSKSGSEAASRKTSEERAQAVKAQLLKEAPTLAPKLRPRGMGWNENLVGSGTDDARDALDRRVEFRVVPCR